MGKTMFYERFVKNSPAVFKFVFDHEGEFAESNGVTPVLFYDEFSSAVVGGLVVFDPAEMFPGKTPEAFNFFCDFCFATAQAFPGPKLIACDELQKLTGTNVFPDELACVIETGRRYELDLICVSHSPNLLHTRIRNQFTDVISFRQVDERAMGYLQDLGFDPSELRELPAGSFIARNVGTGAVERGTVFKKGAQNVESNLQPETQRDLPALPGAGEGSTAAGGGAPAATTPA